MCITFMLAFMIWITCTTSNCVWSSSLRFPSKMNGIRKSSTLQNHIHRCAPQFAPLLYGNPILKWKPYTHYHLHIDPIIMIRTTRWKENADMWSNLRGKKKMNTSGKLTVELNTIRNYGDFFSHSFYSLLFFSFHVIKFISFNITYRLCICPILFMQL